LDKDWALLKERCLGIEVFGRDPGYDTDQDTVVRAAANEVRKRIAQYYHELGHESEIHIDLPAGSYVAEFHLPAEAFIHASAPPIPAASPAIRPPNAFLTGRRRLILLVLLAVVVTLTAALVLSRRISRARFPSTSAGADSAGILKPASNGLPTIDDFWMPFLERSTPLLLCVGETPRGNSRVAFADSDAVMRLTDYLVQKDHVFQIKTASSATASDMKQSGVVLIDGTVNPWTVRTIEPLRFHFATNGGVGTPWIEDRKNSSMREWSFPFTEPAPADSKDYGIVARFLDPETKQWVLVAAGLGRTGTTAAVEFLTEPKYIEEISNHAPNVWPSMNLEVVLTIQLSAGKASPPQIIAVETW
jgi:hypothetical protein